LPGALEAWIYQFEQGASILAHLAGQAGFSLRLEAKRMITWAMCRLVELHGKLRIPVHRTKAAAFLELRQY
jgi:hypothetical protein